VEALRELAEVPYDRILPPRLYKQFAASVKLTFTRDGETDIPVIRGSSLNIVVTNIEKIRITAETIRKGDLGGLFADARTEEEAKREVANRRLQTLASLPRLAIFSDEAHHLYGQSLDTRLKRVRQTVDYLADNTQVICVVNTTGTPYYKRQPLKDVVIWYGLRARLDQEDVGLDAVGETGQIAAIDAHRGACLDAVGRAPPQLGSIDAHRLAEGVALARPQQVEAVLGALVHGDEGQVFAGALDGGREARAVVLAGVEAPQEDVVAQPGAGEQEGLVRARGAGVAVDGRCLGGSGRVRHGGRELGRRHRRHGVRQRQVAEGRQLLG